MNSDPFRFYNKGDAVNDFFDIRFSNESMNSEKIAARSKNNLTQEQKNYNTLIEQTILTNKGYNNIVEELLKYKVEFERKKKNNENINDDKRYIILSLNEKKQNFKKQINENMVQIINYASDFSIQNFKEKNEFTHKAIYDDKNLKWNFIRKKLN